jgi:hypothetical protein
MLSCSEAGFDARFMPKPIGTHCRVVEPGVGGIDNDVHRLVPRPLTALL